MSKEFDLEAQCLIKGLMYGIVLIALYFTSHQLMIRWWENEDYNYCYLIPFVVLYLIWEKRSVLTRMEARPSWVGMIPFGIGLALFWLGELGGEYYTMYLSSWFVLLGLCWIHLGWRKLKVILFPIAFILTMFPPPNFIYFNLSLKLKLISSKLGVWALQSLGQSAYREGNVIDLGFTQLQVVDACNGIRYLFPLLVLSLLVAYFSKSDLWKRVIIVISAIPISIFVNGLRIASVGWLYPIWGPKVAVGFFHDFSGWVIFMISLGVLLVEIWILDKLIRNHRKGRPQKSFERESYNQQASSSASWWTSTRSPRFIIAILLLGSTTAIAQTVNFREAVPISRPFSQFPLRIGQWTGQPGAMDQKILNSLAVSDYILTDYKNESGRSVNLYSAYYESQRKGASIHSPSSCLPGSGWIYHESGKSIVKLDNKVEKPIEVNRAFIQKGDAKQLSYYWFPMRGRIVTNIWEMKLYNFWDALTRQRTDGALVRIMTPVYGHERVDTADERLQEFMGDVLPVLDAFIPK